MYSVSERVVLVVDDNEAIRDSLADFLSCKGYGVFTAGDGNEALRIIKGKRLGILVTDLNMPEKNGVELIRAVRNLKIPLTVIGMSTEPNEYVLLNAGADYFLPKPFDFHALECILNTIFQK